MVDRLGTPVSHPRRMCVGCRERAATTDLIRFVLVERFLTLDPRNRMPGRGAWLHPVRACLDLAERRRAFGRALRTQGPLDVSAVRDAIERHAEQQRHQ